MLKKFFFLIFMLAAGGALGAGEDEEGVPAKAAAHPLQAVMDPTSFTDYPEFLLPQPDVPLKQLTPLQKAGCCLCLWSPCLCLGACFNSLTAGINWATCGCFYGMLPCLDSQ